MSLPLGHLTVTCVLSVTLSHGNVAAAAAAAAATGQPSLDIIVMLQGVRKAHNRFCRRRGVGAAREKGAGHATHTLPRTTQARHWMSAPAGPRIEGD
jgi:hypothetical protein